MLAVIPLMTGALVLTAFANVFPSFFPIIMALWVLTNNIDFSSWSCHGVHQEYGYVASYNKLLYIGTLPNFLGRKCTKLIKLDKNSTYKQSQTSIKTKHRSDWMPRNLFRGSTAGASGSVKAPVTLELLLQQEVQLSSPTRQTPIAETPAKARNKPERRHDINWLESTGNAIDFSVPLRKSSLITMTGTSRTTSWILSCPYLSISWLNGLCLSSLYFPVSVYIIPWVTGQADNLSGSGSNDLPYPSCSAHLLYSYPCMFTSSV